MFCKHCASAAEQRPATRLNACLRPNQVPRSNARSIFFSCMLAPKKKTAPVSGF
jgi:hypothetical protein